jgi:hypothetical protein
MGSSISVISPYARRRLLAVADAVYPEKSPKVYHQEHRAIANPTFWICGCGRQHKIPNVERRGFTCPVCEEVYRG